MIDVLFLFPTVNVNLNICLINIRLIFFSDIFNENGQHLR